MGLVRRLNSKYAGIVEELINAHIEMLRSSGLNTLAPVLFTIRGAPDKPEITGNVLIGPKEHIGKMIEMVVSQAKPQAVLLLNEAHMVQLDLEEDPREEPSSLETALRTPVSKNPSAVDSLVCMYVDKDTVAMRAVILKEMENGNVFVSEDLGWSVGDFGGRFYEIGKQIQRILKKFS